MPYHYDGEDAPEIEELVLLATVEVSPDVDVMVARQVRNDEVTFVIKSKGAAQSGHAGALRLTQDEAVRALMVIQNSLHNWWRCGLSLPTMFTLEGPTSMCPKLWKMDGE